MTVSAAQYVFSPPARVCAPVAGTGTVFPIHRIYCVGQNYREHTREMGGSLREPPFFFSKPADAACFEPVVPFPPLTENLHHEVELVVALGSGGVNIKPENALDLVYGYAVGVDLTRRDLQAGAKKLGRPWTTAKGFDRSAPLSAIRPVGGGGHPANASIALRVNDEQRQSGNINQMTWSVAEIIAGLSGYFELHAGDLIFTGTPSGVGRLQAGDRVSCEIENVGTLDFLVAEANGK